LEDKGLIDGNQKAVMKDLIISGDEELQAALDKYEQGDTAILESMIRSGELMNRAAADIDLLGDLDLDFLNVDDHFQDIGPPMDQHAFSSKEISYSNAEAGPTMVSPHDEVAIDDIHGDFYNEDYLKQASVQHDTRFRSNSLAYGPLLNDEQLLNDQHQTSGQYGRWMDRHLGETRDGRTGSVVSYASADAPPPSGIGGIAESLAQYAKTRGEAKPMTKAQLTEAKRREKAEKKEQREREKAEQKEERERAKAEKKERSAREKQEKKDKKTSTGIPKAKNSTKSTKKEEREEQEYNHIKIPSGLGLPRSMSDPNLSTSIDDFGLLNVQRPDGWVGAYSPESRKVRIERFMEKRNNRVWTKKVKYGVRKHFADSRLRVKGRFVKKEEELLMRDLMSLT
jgi:septum formation inhibitor MinC